MNQTYYASENAVIKQHILFHGSFYIILLYISLVKTDTFNGHNLYMCEIRRKKKFCKCSIDLPVLLSNGINFTCM